MFSLLECLRGNLRHHKVVSSSQTNLWVDLAWPKDAAATGAGVISENLGMDYDGLVICGRVKFVEKKYGKNGNISETMGNDCP